MSEPIISDDEKNALLEGVESGDIEVHSSTGPRYATVENFQVAARNRIQTNSFPRLQQLNRNLASAAAKSVSKLLNEKIDVLPGSTTVGTWGEFSTRSGLPAVLFEFSANPMEGSAVVFVEAAMVRLVVETFYGGAKFRAGHGNADGFTLGELNVTALFCQEVLDSLATSWQGLADLDPKRVGVHQSTDIVDIIESSVEVVSSQFDVRLGDTELAFHIVWPLPTLAPVIPVLEGQKRHRDAAEDARWESVLRARVPEAVVDLTTCIGSARLSLRNVAQLSAGDIVDLDYPRKGTVFAGRIPILEGRFGVHEGHYAIEAGRWLNHGSA